MEKVEDERNCPWGMDILYINFEDKIMGRFIGVIIVGGGSTLEGEGSNDDPVRRRPAEFV